MGGNKMLNSMYSGISGLNANQRKLDVIGNNIANSGTTAFKASSITFQDSMYQTIKPSAGSSLNIGGINPSQVGLGVSVQGINVNMKQGSLQPTGRPLDMAIDGQGYFIVAKGEEKDNLTSIDANHILDGKTMEVYYTRDGSFKLDTEGRLLSPNGYRIMGYQMKDGASTSPKFDATGKPIAPDYIDADSTTAVADQNKLVPLRIPEEVNGSKVQSFSIEKDGMVKVVLASGKTAVLGQVAMASFKNEAGLQQAGQNMYKTSNSSGTPIVRSGKGAIGAADNSKAYGDMVQGALEMSNTDLAVQFTDMIVASRSFQACGKVISTGDEILQELVNLKR
jgi:flagellar hook protein FlgE